MVQRAYWILSGKNVGTPDLSNPEKQMLLQKAWNPPVGSQTGQTGEKQKKTKSRNIKIILTELKWNIHSV